MILDYFGIRMFNFGFGNTAIREFRFFWLSVFNLSNQPFKMKNSDPDSYRDEIPKSEITKT
jgi:hypothetical protein